MVYALSFLAGGIVIGSLFIAVLFDEAGEKTDAYKKVMEALQRFRGII